MATAYGRRWVMDDATSPDKGLPMERVLYEVKKVIVGQDHLLERLVVALLARGHMLVEGVPGLAKTMAIKTLAEALGGEFKRIQFTPDLVPADLIGTRIYNQKTGEFTTALGPIFTNLLLADEINRAPAKVQSALLDRFMLKVLVGYPSATEEFVIVERMIGVLPAVHKVLTTGQLLDLQQAADNVYVDPALIQYAIQIVGATRTPQEVGLKELQPYIMFGASPRASINLIRTARALAFVRGRTYALPQDVLDMVLDVLRHRLVLSYEALSDNVTSDDLLHRILDRMPVPVVPLHEHTAIRAHA